MAEEKVVRTAIVLCALLASLVPVACGQGPETRTRADAGPAPSAADSGAATPGELTSATRLIVAFLRGDASFDAIRTADSVALHLTVEGGGAHVVRTRAALADRAAWAIPSRGATYSLVPPDGERTLTVAPGIHFNCREYALSSRLPELSALPHVGVRLMPPAAGSCLESWNATFVFDPKAETPTLVAVVYDQWEW